MDALEPESLQVPLLLSVVQFHTGVQEEFHAIVCTDEMDDKCKSLDRVRNKVDNIEKQDGGTDLWTGLEYVTDVVSGQLRKGSQKVLVTITDGSPSDEENPRVLAVAKTMFDQMLAVGVGQDLNENVLKKLSKVEPIHVTDFSALDGIVQQMTRIICTHIEENLIG